MKRKNTNESNLSKLVGQEAHFGILHGYKDAVSEPAGGLICLSVERWSRLKVKLMGNKVLTCLI